MIHIILNFEIFNRRMDDDIGVVHSTGLENIDISTYINCVHVSTVVFQSSFTTCITSLNQIAEAT